MIRDLLLKAGMNSFNQSKAKTLMLKQIVCLVLLGFASGCTLIPDYERPAFPIPAKYPSGVGRSPNVEDICWSSFFLDPRLKSCIALALDNNRDLRIAVLNVEQAQAQYRIQRSVLAPEIGAAGAFTRIRSMEDGDTSNIFDASVGITAYELDLFGRVRSNNRKALEEYFSLAESRRGAHIALVAQVATQYLALCEFEEQLELARRTLISVQSSRKLIEKRVAAGTASESDIASTDVQEQSARANIQQYERLMAQAGNTLVELTGKSLPENLPPGHPLSSQQLLAGLRSGLPSDLIARRPDILAAEHQLLAANADVGAARAAFFPVISITGNAGGASEELGDLFSKAGRVWSFSPRITVPIFTGGRNRATLDAAQIRKSIEVARYEKVIQTAFREVSDGLVARSSFAKQLAAQNALVKAQQARYDVAQRRFSEGISSYLEVLLAEQDLYLAQQGSISTRAAELVNLVNLYKALGGGWNK